MRISTLSAIALACTASAVLLPAAAIGGTSRPESSHRHDDDAEHQAVLRGDVLPIARILSLTAGYQAGHVIGIDLDSGRSGLVYDVDVLTADGRVRDLRIDARNGTLIANRADED